MRRFSSYVLLPMLMAAIVLGGTATSQAFFSFGWWGGFGSPHRAGYAPYSVGYAPYSVGYAPTYSVGYAPTYTAAYAPTYTAAYVPRTSYYVGSAPTAAACCEVQTALSPVNPCCPPASACVACYAPCCPADCPVPQNSGDSGNVQPRPAGSQGRTPTFIEDQDRGIDYDNNFRDDGTEDGFSPRRSGSSADPLDPTIGASRGESLRFKIPEAVIHQREPAPTHSREDDQHSAPRFNNPTEPAYPVLNLDGKITSRSTPQRTRLIQRRSWEQPALAKNVTRETPDTNLGWVPVPAPTQLVQK